MRGAAAIASALACAALFAACGGSDDASSADAEAIEAAIVISGTTDDPSECTELETQRFVEQISAQKGAAALASCKSPGDDSADSIEVSAISVDGENATAEAAVSGGGFDGQTLRFSLLKEDGRWKLDHLDAFADFDRDRFISAFTATFVEGGGFNAQQSACIAGALEDLDDDALEDLVINADRNKLFEVLGPCVTRAAQ